MIPRFRHERPATLAAAFEAFAAANGDAAYYAGGTELLQVMKMGFAQFGTLIDLKGLPELRGVDRAAEGAIRIGATTTHREIERSETVRDAAPALVDLVRRVANARVRNTGTLGGNLCFAEPHSDPATLLLACDATVTLEGPGGSRSLGIADFVIGPLLTARAEDEILVAVDVPAARSGEGRAFDKLAFFERPAASVAVALVVADGAITAARVAVGSMTDIPTILPGAESRLVGAPVDGDGLDAAIAAAGDDLWSLEIVEDLNGSAEYKRDLARSLLDRVVRSALVEARAHA